MILPSREDIDSCCAYDMGPSVAKMVSRLADQRDEAIRLLWLCIGSAAWSPSDVEEFLSDAEVDEDEG